MSGLYLGAMSCIWVSASRAHLCGFLQPFHWSCMQSVHMQAGEVWCSLCLRTLSLFDNFIRSAMDFVVWFFSRHFEGTFVSGQFTTPGWYHKGSIIFSFVDSWSAPRFVLYFLLLSAFLRCCFLVVSVLGLWRGFPMFVGRCLPWLSLRFLGGWMCLSRCLSLLPRMA